MRHPCRPPNSTPVPTGVTRRHCEVVYPPLLAIIVATLLILVGAMLVAVGYYQRKLRVHYDNPAVELFFRL